MFHIVKKPLVTEKNSLLAESGVYVFEVDRRASKLEVRSAIEKYFRVNVESVNTAVCRGKPRRARLGARKVKYWKKALVKLRAGEKIGLFEGV